MNPQQNERVTQLDSLTRLDGKVAVVTGAGSGIGRSVAQTLGAAGASVVACDIDELALADAVAAMSAEGASAIAATADVRSRRDLDAAVDTAVSKFGRLDIQCNIAGIPSLMREFLEVTDDDIDEEMTNSFKGLLHSCQAAAPAMIAGGGGAIVNMSSTSIDVPAPTSGLYHLGKVSAVALTQVLANELGPQGIRVNAIAPGVTLTPFSTRHFTGDDGEVDEAKRQDWLEAHAAKTPLGIVGAPSDQALLVLYLVSDAARFVTGQVVRANGGWTMG